MVQTLLVRYFSLDTKNHDWPQVYSIFVAAIGAFTCSTFFAWPSPTIPILLSNSSHIGNVTFEEASYFAVIPPLAALISTPFVTILLDRIGRKNTIVLMIIPHIISWVLIAVANSILVLYISRVLYGISDLILHCIPTYIGEISTPKVRGSWGNLVTVLLFLGVLIINVVGSYNDIQTTALICLIFPVLNILLIAIVPESPYYLLMKGRVHDAENSLKLLRWNKNVQEEFTVITNDVLRQTLELGTMKDLWTIPTNRRALLIVLFLRISQQLSGHSAFAIYSQYIFSISGGNISASSSAIIYASALFTMSAVFSFTVNSLGRRRLIILSTIGCTIALFSEAVYFYLMKKTNIDLTNFNWIPLTFFLLYIVSFTPGLGILPTLMLGELFSSSIKAKAVGVHMICHSLGALTVPKLFQFLSSRYGMYVPFCLFGSCTAISFIFSYFFVPETKMKTLEEIQQMLMKGITKPNKT